MKKQQISILILVLLFYFGEGCYVASCAQRDIINSLNDQGFDCIMKEQYDQAIADYTQIIELQPYCADAYLKRGYAYLQINKFAKAIADYSQAVELKPYSAETYQIRGAAYGNNRLYARAIADANKAIELRPTYVDAYLLRGNVYRDKGDLIWR